MIWAGSLARPTLEITVLVVAAGSGHRVGARDGRTSLAAQRRNADPLWSSVNGEPEKPESNQSVGH